MFLTSIATIAVSLTVFGFFILVSLNLHSISNYMSSKFEILVTVQENLPQQDIKRLRAKLSRMPLVHSATFVDKDKAWAEFKKKYTHLELANLIDVNPLPHSITLQVVELNEVKGLVASLKKETPTIDDIIYSGDLSEKLIVFAKYSQIIGLCLVGFLLLATLLIIINTIRLTVLARIEEVTIMQLVGATNGLIRGPFLFEGMIIGLIGALTANLILYFGYQYITQVFFEFAPYFPIVSDKAIVFTVLLIVGASGPLIGLLGSNISISRSLKL